MRTLSACARVGTALLIAVVVAAPFFNVVAGSIPLTALALSAILLGGIALLLARSLPAVVPQAAELLPEGSGPPAPAHGGTLDGDPDRLNRAPCPSPGL